MKKKLAQIYQENCITGTIPQDVNKYYWFIDEENLPIGIRKTISKVERELIELSYARLAVNKLHDTKRLQWLNFLVGNGFKQFPEKALGIAAINFIFFFHDLDNHLQREFEALAQGFNGNFEVFFLEPGYGFILDLSAVGVADSSELKDFLLASKQDFSSELIFYQTINYTVDERLPEKFSAEFALFKEFKRADLDLMKYPDIFLNYLGSSEVIAKHAQFNDWFKAFFTVDVELLAVVKCYLENGFNITTGAKVMHMHRNTFMNKLDRFVSITGIDVKNFDEATIAYLLIRLRKDG